MLAPFRALATPLADMVHPMPYPEIYPPEDPDYHPLAISKNLFVDGFDEAVATTILERLEASDASMRVAQLRVLGGAYARVPNDATAYAHRDRRIMVNVASFYEGPDDREVRAERGSRTSPPPLAAGDDEAAYVNFIGDEGEDTDPGRLSGRDLGPAGGDQGPLRPDEPVPDQPEHPARGAAGLRPMSYPEPTYLGEPGLAPTRDPPPRHEARTRAGPGNRSTRVD